MIHATDQTITETPAAPEATVVIGSYQIHPAAALLPDPTPLEYSG